MSDDKNIKNYSAADFERYWSDKLSAAEMHALEKAAMDDAFLADALEGYKNISATQADLDLLKEKLGRRVKGTPSLIYLKRKKFAWLRVAAAVIIITGLGLLTQQLLLKKSTENSIAQTDKTEASKPATATNNNELKLDTLTTTAIAAPDSVVVKSGKINTEKINHPAGYTPSTIDTTKDSKETLANAQAETQRENNAAAVSPVIVNAEKKTEALKEKDISGKAAEENPPYAESKSLSASPRAKQATNENDKSAGVLLNNRYSYRVVDEDKNPVPFANVMNTQDNVGTYSDIRGMFNLVSGDSILNVQIKSLGYNSSNYKLVPSKTPGDLVLKEDDAIRKQILADNRKVASTTPQKDSAVLVEPEVGWGYYNTYIANNIQIPDNIRTKNSGRDVELSFDIDKNGQPVNIRVTRSSQCKECDEEAIRLLKEGPKWKRKANKSKGFVIININK